MTSTIIGLAIILTAASAPAQAHETVRVYLSNGAFCNAPVCQPATSEDTTVEAGDTVEWVFADAACYVFDVAFAGIPCWHDVVSEDGGPLASGRMSVQDGALVYTHTFDTPGTYRYKCSLHGDIPSVNMRATIIVE